MIFIYTANCTAGIRQDFFTKVGLVMKQKSDVELLLEAWGRWVRTWQDTPNCSPLYRLMREHVGGVVSDPVLPDDTALRVDALVARLTCKSKEEGTAIFLLYGLAMPRDAAARKMRIGETKIKMLQRAGLAWLEGFLQGLEAA